MTSVEQFLADLQAATIGKTFNEYRETGPNDVPGAPAIRQANLRHYLSERQGAPVLAIGEAAGFQGMRWSGIAFTSERDIAKWGEPYRSTCNLAGLSRKSCWSEPSGTMVHRVLRELGAEHRVILWNTVPTHPHKQGVELSNQRPSVQEVAQGKQFALRLLEILRPEVVIAVGRIAEAALKDSVDLQPVRHPANAGYPKFAEGMRRILAQTTK